jgi:two-component system CheB/CheR fusion protein
VKAEAALRESEGRLRTLLSELQHRVRNTLAIVKSITRRTADSSGSVEEMAAHLNGRLEAFARVQSAVTRNPDAGVDLRSLVDDELLAHAVHEGDGLAVDGPQVSLRPKAAESISLALHELATNAVKHGALAHRNGGKIAVSWQLNGDGEDERLKFEWTETNSNGQIPKPTRHGFGIELLTRILPYDLQARTNLEFQQGGLRFEMDLPTEHLVERVEE